MGSSLIDPNSQQIRHGGSFAEARPAYGVIAIQSPAPSGAGAPLVELAPKLLD